MATSVKSTSVSPTSSAYTGGSWTPYGYLSPAAGMDLLHQSVAYNTAMKNLRGDPMSGGGGYFSTGASGGAGGGGYGAYPQRAVAISGGGFGGGSAKEYEQLEKDIKGWYNKMLQEVAGTTSQREADIRRAYAGQQSDVMQNLARLGMANTTIAPTLGMGIQREQEESLNRLADALLGTKLGVMGTKASEMARIREAGLQAGRLSGMQQLQALGAFV